MIPYNGWDREYKENKESYLALFDKFMCQTNYEDCSSFEDSFADYIGRKHAVSVANATDALYFSLLAHNIGPGDEVLVSDFSWISTASCISMAGATPVFCDIDLDSYHIDLESMEKMFSNKTKAVIYTHLFGNMTDTTEIESFCRKKDIAFIEDAAQSLGSSLNGVEAGTIGDSSSFSFNTNKVIAGINGGGIYLTDDDNHATFVKKIRRHGKEKDFEFLGYNSRMYVLNAEIINLRFQNMLKYQEKRQEIAQKYNKAFIDLPVHLQKTTNNLEHNFHKYVVRFENKEIRKKVKKSLSASIHYEVPLSDNSMYRMLEHRKDDCQNSKLAADTVLSLPIHAWLKDEEIEFVIDTLKSNF